MNLITHREAARRMHVNEKRLRERVNGTWKNYPQFGRFQEAPGCTIWMIEEQVSAWVEERDKALMAVTAPVIKLPASLADKFRASGHVLTAKLVEKYI